MLVYKCYVQDGAITLTMCLSLLAENVACTADVLHLLARTILIDRGGMAETEEQSERIFLVISWNSDGKNVRQKLPVL